MMNFTISPAITALVSVILFSTGGLVIKWMPLPPLALSGSRALVAAITLAIYIRVQFPHLKLVAFNPVKCLVILSYVVMTICYVFAMKLTTAANAIFLQYTMPAWFFWEERSAGGTGYTQPRSGDSAKFNRNAALLKTNLTRPSGRKYSCAHQRHRLCRRGTGDSPGP